MAKIASKVKEKETKVEISEDVQSIFSEFKEKYGRVPKISAEIFQGFFDEETEDHEMSEWLDSLKEMEDRLEKTGTSKAKEPHVSDKLAQELGAIAAKDEEFLGHVTMTVEYKEGLKRLPAMLALDMQRMYTPEQIEAFPEPGLKATDLKPGDNRKPDITKVGEPSWYQDFWATLPISDQVKKDLEEISKKAAGPGVKADKSMFTQRRTNGVGAVRTAVQILKGFAKFKAETDLECFLRTEKKDGKQVIQRTISPIRIKFKDGSGDEQYFSVGTFKLLCSEKSFSKIVKAEDQMKALEVDRKPRVDKGTTSVNVQTISQGIQAYHELGFALKDDPKFRSGIYEEADKKEELSDELILSMHYVSRYTDRYLDRPAVRQRLLALLEKEEAEEKKANKEAA